MNAVPYIVLALGATLIGSVSGMGGGVIIKPVMDFMGDYDSSVIGVLSSITVFSMSFVSLVRGYAVQKKAGNSLPVLKLIILSLGSVCGGIAGQYVYTHITYFFQNNRSVTLIQNICLFILVGFVFVYMIKSDTIKNRSFSSAYLYALCGVMLGFISSFLGIGGGPFNVALLMYLFSFDIKSATLASLMTIFFAQVAKLTSVLFTTGFSVYNLEMAPFMVVCAVIGGLAGTRLKAKLSARSVAFLFNCVQVCIMILCVVNVLRSLC
ncbi:sulfite exporter TauE/SafE family protein [Treponema sp. OMZ 840]|uniref:sulfite exporter TauE/SafE family protein n=1 Tax=Treponema sp. OMZ 840 TaxID=244313 RepID=UPI003D8E8183